MKTMKSIWVVLISFSLLCWFSYPAAAQEREPTPSDDAVNAVAREMYCPVCENVPLDVCGTQACIQWRDMIREQLAAGRQPEEIKAMFVAQYGEQVLAEPRWEGLNVWLYLLPLVFVLFGLGSLLIFGKRYRPQYSMEGSKTEELTPYIEKLETDLKNHRYQVFRKNKHE